jgi:hypothetical protein
MSKDTPEVGDVWVKRYSKEDKIYITQGLPMIIDVNMQGVFEHVNKRDFLNSYCYLGKSNVNIDDLFKTENEE